MHQPRRGRFSCAIVAGILLLLIPSGLAEASSATGVDRKTQTNTAPYCERIAVQSVAEEKPSSHGRDMWGIRSHMYSFDYYFCNRVSSMTVLGPQDHPGVDRQGVEFGWVLGYSNCNGVFYQTPRLFVWWNRLHQGPYCQVLSKSAVTHMFHVMSLYDNVAHYQWDTRYDGTLLAAGITVMDFKTGTGLVSVERSNYNDSAYGDDMYVSEWHPMNHWSHFDHIYAPPNLQTDPVFFADILSPDHVKFKK